MCLNECVSIFCIHQSQISIRLEGRVVAKIHEFIIVGHTDTHTHIQLTQLRGFFSSMLFGCVCNSSSVLCRFWGRLCSSPIFGGWPRVGGGAITDFCLLVCLCVCVCVIVCWPGGLKWNAFFYNSWFQILSLTAYCVWCTCVKL